MIKKVILLLLCINVVALAIMFFQDVGASILHEGNGEDSVVTIHGGPTTIQLQNRPFTVFDYPSPTSPPLAVILFASGDGGWTGWEDALAHDLQSNGYTVIGINSGDYAKTDYDLATLQADYSTIAKKALAAYPNAHPPVILCGWSMGAAQAIAVAGGPNRPPGLIGLAVASALSRGRYGLRVSDQIDLLPPGPGTFAVTDFIPGLNGLSLVQFHGEFDPSDSTVWLSQLKIPHQEIDFRSWHDFDRCSPPFRRKFVEGVNWILKSAR